MQVVAGLIINEDKVLIAQRPKGKNLAGYWEFPGGKIENQENPVEALKRELKEELGITISTDKTKFFHENIHTYENGIIKLFSFKIGSFKGKPISKEHAAIEWVNIHDLMLYELAPADVPVAKKLSKEQPIKRSSYAETIATFLKQSENEIKGQLEQNHTNRSLVDLQRNSWTRQIRILKNILSPFEGKIYFEFSIPRMGKKVDNILIINGDIYVVEFKVGEQDYHSHEIDQVVDYALDLKDFHEGSHDKTLIPVLLCTSGKEVQNELNLVIDLKTSLKVNPNSFHEFLETRNQNLAKSFDIKAWESSNYKPTPTIVQAAQALYKGHNVKEISRNDAGKINLSKSSDELNQIIESSKKAGKKSICFLTGIPGAGKTLAGLNIANERLIADEDEHSVFLSGNGPLVQVLREALARDLVSSSKENGNPVTKKDAQRRTNAFIQNIHHFRDEYLKNSNAPTEKVVVFDEAQRAWDKAQATSFMKRKRGDESFQMSEPEFLIEVMDRHEDWCCIVCLIGGGQEINTGEAGISEWISVLKNRFTNWDIYFSDRMIIDENYLTNNDLSDWLTKTQTKKSSLHLGISVRSFRSEKVSELVEHILNLNLEKSKLIYYEIFDSYPVYITRELKTTKDWLKSQSRGTQRFGIISSSGARRLKAIGLNVKNEFKPTDWFLNAKSDVRSSFYLEDIATEFDIQGLEIDWACVAWGGNFYKEGNIWKYQAFKGSKWQKINKKEGRQYLKNSYRVLLTRARQGLIIFIPKGSLTDPTRAPKFYEGTYNFLKEIGIPEV